MFKRESGWRGRTCSRVEISDLEMCLEEVYGRYETRALNTVLVQLVGMSAGDS